MNEKYHHLNIVIKVEITKMERTEVAILEDPREFKVIKKEKLIDRYQGTDKIIYNFYFYT